MSELDRRTQALRELSHLPGLPDSPVRKNELKKTQVYGRNRLPGERTGLVEEAIELVIPPPDNAARLLRFIVRLEETLDDSRAGIKYMVPSGDGGIVITVMTRSNTLVGILDKLGSIPGVEEVKEEPWVGGAVSSIPKRFGFLTRPGISPSKMFHIILKETDTARQELVPVLA